MEKSFGHTTTEYGVTVTLTVTFLSATSASFAAIGGLNDAESSEVCSKTFASTALGLAELSSQALDVASGHALQHRSELISSRPSSDLLQSDC